MNTRQRLTMTLTLGLLLFSATASAAPDYKADVASNEAYAKALLHLHSFMLGSKGPVITAFFDPNCIWCHEFYRHAQPYIREGRLRVRVVMVGTLKHSSAPKAETIVAARDPAKALAYDESHYTATSEEGGIVPATHIPPAARAEIRDNTAFLANTTGPLTPTLVILRAGHLMVDKGYPSQTGVGGIIRQWGTP